MDPTLSLAEIVVAAPHRAAVLERLGLDYCCGGRQTLAEACTARGLEPATVVAMFEALDAIGSGRSGDHDLRDASIEQICEHVVVAHHGPLRASFDRIAHLLATVVRVHGAQRPELAELQRVFLALREELEEHMLSEERVLFPACRELERGARPELEPELLRAVEDEHGDVGIALARMQELADDYRTDAALCGTHRALLDALLEFTSDLHQHIHEENNILLPRVRALLLPVA